MVTNRPRLHCWRGSPLIPLCGLYYFCFLLQIDVMCTLLGTDLVALYPIWKYQLTVLDWTCFMSFMKKQNVLVHIHLGVYWDMIQTTYSNVCSLVTMISILAHGIILCQLIVCICLNNVQTQILVSQCIRVVYVRLWPIV